MGKRKKTLDCSPSRVYVCFGDPGDLYVLEAALFVAAVEPVTTAEAIARSTCAHVEVVVNLLLGKLEGLIYRRVHKLQIFIRDLLSEVLHSFEKVSYRI